MTTQFADDARRLSNGEQGEEDNDGGGSGADGGALDDRVLGCRGDAHRGEEGEEEGQEGGAEVAVFDVDDAVDAECDDTEEKRYEPEGVGCGSPGGVQAGVRGREGGQRG